MKDILKTFIIFMYLIPFIIVLMFSCKNLQKSCRARDRMVVGFTTICAIGAYRH